MAVAEKKYDLALVKTQTEKKIRPQPWYKERLETKYLKSLKQNDISGRITGKNWIFIKDGLDDFRDGLPPAVEGSDFVKWDGSTGPNVTGESAARRSVKQQAVRHRFSKEQICFSRVLPLQQQRREHIDQIEYGLLQHPLALYPHLEESLPPEEMSLTRGMVVRFSLDNLKNKRFTIFEDVVGIMDPEMNIVEENEEDLADVIESKEQETEPASAETVQSDKPETQDESGTVRNPYRWLPRREEKEKQDRRSHKNKSSLTQSQEEHIKMVTQEFCKWVADLGGESNNIEESTISSLFASGYETKPALSVPIHVVELTNVPPELRLSASPAKQIHQFQQPDISPPQTGKIKQQEWRYSGEYQPSWVKFKYGSWYLPPKVWEKRDWNEPLVDPRHQKDTEMSESKRRSQKLNQLLSTMHASKAFMEFINKKTVRKPEFLEEVAQIQRTAEEEERKRLEAEMLAKQKKTAGNVKKSKKEKK